MTTDLTDGMVSVKVQITLTALVPADPDTRQELYGTTDPAECLRIDLENDPAAFLMESDTELDYTTVEVAPS